PLVVMGISLRASGRVAGGRGYAHAEARIERWRGGRAIESVVSMAWPVPTTRAWGSTTTRQRRRRA
ncbi:MAG: hypothetical protein JWQ48_3431, partial [Conexibacter sp.]|nr:hypothetical protein [Conexibacter sp.]